MPVLGGWRAVGCRVGSECVICVCKRAGPEQVSPQRGGLFLEVRLYAVTFLIKFHDELARVATLTGTVKCGYRVKEEGPEAARVEVRHYDNEHGGVELEVSRKLVHDLDTCMCVGKAQKTSSSIVAASSTPPHQPPPHKHLVDNVHPLQENRSALLVSVVAVAVPRPLVELVPCARAMNVCMNVCMCDEREHACLCTCDCVYRTTATPSR